MGEITERAAKRPLLATNIFTLAVLIVVMFKENYPQRVYHGLFSKQKNQEQKPPRYADNPFYEYYTTTYPLIKTQKNIVMLGNSFTACVDWKELFSRPDVTAMGIPGDITQGVIARLDYLLALKPKICFIEGGVNDLNADIPNDTIIKNLSIIIDKLEQHGVKPVLMAVTLLAEKFALKNPAKQNVLIKELNEQIYNLAKIKNVSLIDLNPYLTNKNFRISEYAITDGIHYTDKTYMIWKREAEKILQREGI